MCGFGGFWDVGRRYPAAELGRLVAPLADALAHRGPDDSGRWVDEEAGVALGHRRLSILDLSAEGHQPMVSPAGRYVVAFNGEIYNFAGLRGELLRSGYAFRGHSDTEVLLAAVEEWGVRGALERFVGMFAFALWDRRERRLVLARDRMGEKPLYYGWVGGAFLFASEIKALRAFEGWRGEVDRDALRAYLRYNYVPSPCSIYRGISKLPPGTFLSLEGSRGPGPLPDPQPYWTPSPGGEQAPRTPEEAADQLEEILRRAVREQMVADVPLGAFLSGGVDSSTIVALMQAQSTRPVKTFTIGFREQAFNEAEHAAEVARHLGTEHTELYVTPAEAMEVIPRLPAVYDEPFADSSQIPTFLISQLARQHVTVSLSGDGGDELFGGYNRYFLAPRIWSRVRWIPLAGRRLAGRGLGAVPPDEWGRMSDRMGRVLPSGLRLRHFGEKMGKLVGVLTAETPDAVFQTLVSNGADLAPAVLGSAEPPVLLGEPGRWPAVDDFAARMMLLDSMTYLPDDILVKVDRAAMAVSLETRVPFLDHRVVDFAWSLPVSMKVRDGRGKWLLRRVLYRHVPEALIERPKMGFSIPVAAWLRGPLREWAEELLDERRMRGEGFLEPGVVRKLWREHLSGARDWHMALWSVLMFEAWLEGTRVRVPCAA